MKSFWFALKIALLFAVVLVVALTGTLMLFGKVAGHGVLRELGLLRAHEGLVLAEQVEVMLEEHNLADPEVLSLVARTGPPLGSEIRVEETGSQAVSTAKRPRHRHQPDRLVTVRGRQCMIVGPPNFETWVPLTKNGETLGFLVLGGPLHPPEDHHDFFVGLLEIGAVTLLGVGALAFYLTMPLRRMARSMNRIADGDLDHRVHVRGKDEVAEVGNSFNQMADRISDMIGGQKELLAGVSHELRSPLTRMKMSLELVRGDCEGSARIDEIEGEIDALDGMVDELLVASRLDMKTDQLRTSPIALEIAARDAWDRIAAEAEAQEMVLKLELGDDAHVVDADNDLLVRTLGNLFENALRYAGTGSVRLASRSSDGRIRIEISDDGPGVKHESLARLFEPFYRADPSRSRRTGATGLGLMIVKRTVEAHGGKVQAFQNSEGGLTVAFDLAPDPESHTSRP